MRIEIPERFHEAMIEVSQFSDDNLELICEAIKSVDVSASVSGLASSLQELLPDLGIKIEDIVSLLVGLQYNINSRSVDVGELLNEVVDSLGNKIQFNSDAFISNGIRLLTSGEAIKTTAKAASLKNDYEKVLLETRIITDIRPVFSNEKEGPKASFVTSNLTIEYYENNEKKKISFAVDSEDLEKLELDVNRAKLKKESLKSFIQKSGMSYLRIED